MLKLSTNPRRFLFAFINRYIHVISLWLTLPDVMVCVCSCKYKYEVFLTDGENPFSLTMIDWHLSCSSQRTQGSFTFARWTNQRR